MNAVIQDTTSEAVIQIDKNQSRTDWARLKAMTDSDIQKAVQDDPDPAPILTKEEIAKRYKLTQPRIKKRM